MSHRLRTIVRQASIPVVAGLMMSATSASAVPITMPAGGVTEIEELSPPDAWQFFRRLVDRYRSLQRYSEEAEVVEVTEDPATDAAPIRSSTRVRAEVDDDRLTVQTSSVVDRVTDALAPRGEGVRESDLWMLPHLRLRFDEQPLETFRPAARQPFRPADVDRVLVEDRELVRVDLLSGETGSPDAKFSLFVDPERMLVERVEGDEWLPGGLRHRTTVRIDSHEVHEVAVPSAQEPATPADADRIDGPSPNSDSAAPASGTSPGESPVGSMGLGLTGIG